MLIDQTKAGCYINGVGVISPQKTFDNGEFLPEVTRYDDNILTCILPDFKNYLNPFQMRRLSRMLRMGLSAAKICLNEAGLKTPDAIITATGFGFQWDMGKFLTEILEQQEQQLTPTYFMQSTHNALSGLIALFFKCMGYNSTYTGRGVAFETALHDAMLLLQEKEAGNVLVGSFDEVYNVQYTDYVRLGYVKREKINNLKLFAYQTEGTLQGEGMAFFVLSNQLQPNNWGRLKNLHMVYRPAGYAGLASELIEFLSENDLAPGDVDILVNGVSGDVVRDQWNFKLQQEYFHHATAVRFKHLTGEYDTASSFGLWLGAKILKTQTVPESILASSTLSNNPFKTALVCNHYLGKYYSFFLLTRE